MNEEIGPPESGKQKPCTLAATEEVARDVTTGDATSSLTEFVGFDGADRSGFGPSPQIPKHSRRRKHLRQLMLDFTSSTES